MSKPLELQYFIHYPSVLAPRAATAVLRSASGKHSVICEEYFYLKSKMWEVTR